MPQQHLDRLTAVDASFLAQEHATSHMHVGALTICEGPAPAYEDFLDHIRSRLHLVPRYRQKLAFPPCGAPPRSPPPRRSRWACRCGSTTRASTSSTTSATRGSPTPGPRSS